MKSKKGWRNPMSMLPLAQMRGPNEPTEYDLALAKFGPGSPELDAWIRKWYWTKYVPENVLIKMGLAERYDGF